MSRFRRSAAVLLACSASVAACSLAYDLTDYSSGTPKDAGADSESDTGSAADSEIADTEIAADTSMADTAKADSTASTDTGSPIDSSSVDSSVVDSSTDAGMADTTVVDSGTDTSVAMDAADATPDTPVDAGCGALCLFGVSEIMVHPVTGAGDRHEWVELTNYDTVPVNISGVTVKVFSSIEKASFTFPAGTTVPAGGAVVVADDDTFLKSDVLAPYTLAGPVFSFASSAGDVFVNSTVTVRIYAPGTTIAYETDVFSRSSWPTGRSFAYPPPTSTCPATARFSATGVPTTAWKDTAADPAHKYGEFPAGTSLYGTPTQPNTGTACP